MDWSYDAWDSGEPYDYGGASRGHTQWDSIDYHVDLGCGKLKKGRIGIDHKAAPGVNIVCDLNTLLVYSTARAPGEDAPSLVAPPGSLPVRMRGLPFEDNSIESIVSHHFLEHMGDGFIPLIDEVYRVLKPDGIFRAVTPLFPSTSAVEDATHCRYFMDRTWDAFCGTPGEEPNNCWLASFSVPYTKARFNMEHKDVTAPTPIHEQWGPNDAREIRVAMRAMK